MVLMERRRQRQLTSMSIFSIYFRETIMGARERVNDLSCTHIEEITHFTPLICAISERQYRHNGDWYEIKKKFTSSLTCFFCCRAVFNKNWREIELKFYHAPSSMSYKNGLLQDSFFEFPFEDFATRRSEWEKQKIKIFVKTKMAVWLFNA